MNTKNIDLISQLASALSDATEKLERYYNDKDYDKFKKIKEEMININKKIIEMAK